jgi:hypothetical protein
MDIMYYHVAILRTYSYFSHFEMVNMHLSTQRFEDRINPQKLFSLTINLKYLHLIAYFCVLVCLLIIDCALLSYFAANFT